MDDTIYQDLIKFYGTQNRIGCMVADCAGLIDAITRWTNGLVSYEYVITKLADVDIMLQQMKIIFDNDSIEMVKQGKLERLRNLMIREEIGI